MRPKRTCPFHRVSRRSRDALGWAASTDWGSTLAWMLDLDVIDVDQIAIAPAGQTDYEHRWLIDGNWRGPVLD